MIKLIKLIERKVCWLNGVILKYKYNEYKYKSFNNNKYAILFHWVS